MSNAGQAVLTIGGTIVGAYFGGPAGAQLGYRYDAIEGAATIPLDDLSPSSAHISANPADSAQDGRHDARLAKGHGPQP